MTNISVISSENSGCVNAFFSCDRSFHWAISYQFRFNLECRLMAAEEGLIEEDDAPAWLLLMLGLTERIVKGFD